MRYDSSDFHGFCVTFQTAGKNGIMVHSFLASRETDGANVGSEIRDVLNNSAAQIADILAKDRARAIVEEEEKYEADRKETARYAVGAGVDEAGSKA